MKEKVQQNRRSTAESNQDRRANLAFDPFLLLIFSTLEIILLYSSTVQWLHSIKKSARTPQILSEISRADGKKDLYHEVTALNAKLENRKI
jgi:hypothetical protein